MGVVFVDDAVVVEGGIGDLGMVKMMMMMSSCRLRDGGGGGDLVVVVAASTYSCGFVGRRCDLVAFAVSRDSLCGDVSDSPFFCFSLFRMGNVTNKYFINENFSNSNSLPIFMPHFLDI